MPQEPLTFVSRGNTLEGTLLFPFGDSPFRTALLLGGSGPLDRDGNAPPASFNTLRALAQALADAGWASFRFDKTGVGESEGDRWASGFREELEDAEAAFSALRARQDVGPVIVVGHGAGGCYGAELAGRVSGLSGAVLLATPAKDGAEALNWQIGHMDAHALPGWIRGPLRLIGVSVGKMQRKIVDKAVESTEDTIRIQGRTFNARWMREFHSYHPGEAFRRVTVPLLAITGSKDIQVDPADLPVIAREARKGAEVYEIPDVDHLLRHEPSAHSRPPRYRRQARFPIDDSVAATLIEWMNRISGRERG